MGYEAIDRLGVYRCAGSLVELRDGGGTSYAVRRGMPQDAARLPFYRVMAPWQTHWPSLTGGDSSSPLTPMEKRQGTPCTGGIMTPERNLTGITLFQCEADPERRDGEAVMRSLLGEAFAPLHQPVKRTAVNLPGSNRTAVGASGTDGVFSGAGAGAHHPSPLQKSVGEGAMTISDPEQVRVLLHKAENDVPSTPPLRNPWPAVPMNAGRPITSISECTNSFSLNPAFCLVQPSRGQTRSPVRRPPAGSGPNQNSAE